MALTHHATQVSWSSSNLASVSAEGNATSDAVTIDPATIEASVSILATNQGTPEEGDDLTAFAIYSNGPTDGGGTDLFDTTEDGIPLGVLPTGGNSPCQITVPLPIRAAKALRIYVANASETNTINVTARVIEKRAG